MAERGNEKDMDNIPKIIAHYHLPGLFEFYELYRAFVSVKASPENRLPAGSFEPAGLLILFICGEIHPFAQRCFAFSVAFVQIQIAV